MKFFIGDLNANTLHCINLQAQSGIAASVAIAVAAVTSGVAARPLPPAGYGPVSAEHLAYLKKSGFPESCLNSLAVFSTQNLDGFTILVGSELIEYISTEDGHLHLQKSPRRVGAADGH